MPLIESPQEALAHWKFMGFEVPEHMRTGNFRLVQCGELGNVQTSVYGVNWTPAHNDDRVAVTNDGPSLPNLSTLKA